MNEQIKDGGPLFPCLIPTGADHNIESPEPVTRHFGMSLRDYFAAKAMQAFSEGLWPDSTDREVITKRAYAMADAMLKARKS